MNSTILVSAYQYDNKANGGIISLNNIIENTDIKNVVIATNLESKWSEEWQEIGCETKIFGGGTSVFDYLKSNIKIFFISRDYKPTVAHINDRDAFLSTALGLKAAGVPIVNNIRDTQPLMHGIRRLKWLIELALSDKALTLSRDMVDRWSKSLRVDSLPEPFASQLENKFDFIYSIVDGNRFHPPAGNLSEDIQHDLGVSGSPLLAYVASFHPKKRQLAFIENCLPKLIEDTPGTRVAFVGDFDPKENNHAEECREAVVELGLGDHVQFAGYRSDVERWYQAADITVLASEKEGLARSMIESIACGTPVVSFDVASAREILERHECGVVVSQGDYNGLSHAVSELWANEQRRNTMGDNGARVARQLFDPDKIVEEYEALYEKLAQGD